MRHDFKENGRRIIKTNFTFEEMLSKPSTEEMRKYFYDNFLIPYYITIEQDSGYRSCLGNSASFLVGRAVVEGEKQFVCGLGQASIIEGKAQERDLPILLTVFKDNVLSAILLKEKPVEFNRLLRKALEQAFSDCVDLEEPCKDSFNTRYSDLNLVLYLSYSYNDNTMKFSMLDCFKDKSKLASKEVLKSRVIDMESEHVFAKSDKYRTAYNVFTGKWLMRTQAGEECDCERCMVIKNSIAKDSAYDDPDLF